MAGQFHVAIARSTKAGVRTPATPASTLRRLAAAYALNEGRGSNPGDTRPWRSRTGRSSHAQRRPGFEPRRHGGAIDLVGRSAASAQRRPGFEPRRHRGHHCPSGGVFAPLNEGRGSNPGDTCLDGGPRQTSGALNEGRGRTGDATYYSAQRRPGFEPRRHTRRPALPGRALRCSEGRTPATPAVRGRRRSTKAGVRTPATHRSPIRISSRSRQRALNEGRGSNPGDTSLRRAARRYAGHWRSTKAGVRTPATHRRDCQTLDGPLNEGRGSPRARNRSAASAQRRPGFEPRRHRVSDSKRTGPADLRSLNEGRGSNPGDTANPIRESLPRKIAQICGHQIPCSHAD